MLATGRFPEWKCRWGWGAEQTAINAMRKDGATDAEVAAAFSRSQVGQLCSSCDVRFEESVAL